MARKRAAPEGWTQRLLDDVTRRVSGHTPSQSHPGYWNGGIKWVSLADSAKLDRGLIHSTAKEISADGLAHSSAVLHPAGTVVLSRDAGVGKSGILATPMAVSQHFIGWLCDGPGQLHNWFLYYWLQYYKKEFERMAVGSTIKTIGLPYFKKLTINFPSYEEQRRIADVLDTWNQAVETTKRLIDNVGRQNQALVQQLVWGKVRLSGYAKAPETQQTKYGRIPSDWGFPAIHQVAGETNERNGGDASLPVLACSKYEGFVESLKYFKKQVYSDNTSNYKVVRRGSYGFPSNHIEEGSLGYQDLCDAGLVSPIYCVFRTSDAVCDGYFYRLLKTDHYRQIFAAATNASVDRRGSLRWNQFSRIHVPLPPLDEQKAIARICDVSDRELKLLKLALANIEKQRTALMHLLLTGELRIQVRETESCLTC